MNVATMRVRVTDAGFDAVRVRVFVPDVVRHIVSARHVCHAAGEGARVRRQALSVHQRRLAVHLLADHVPLGHAQLRHPCAARHRRRLGIRRRGLRPRN